METQPIPGLALGVLLSTVADMARWDAALYTDALLPHTILEEMWAPHHTRTKKRAGVHFYTVVRLVPGTGRSALFSGHIGGIMGFASSYLHFPVEQVSMVLFCNQDAVAEPYKMALFAAEQFLIEMNGIATVMVAWNGGRIRLVNPPRAIIIKLTRGAVFGKPADRSQQERVLAAALDLLSQDAPLAPIYLDETLV